MPLMFTNMFRLKRVGDEPGPGVSSGVSSGVSGALSSGVSSAPDSSAPDSSAPLSSIAIYTNTLVIPAGFVDSDLTDFPVPLFLEILEDEFWNTTNNGEDIRIFSGMTELATDLVYCNTANKHGILWVKVPSITVASGATLSLEADGISSRPANGDANGRNAVWSDYEVVVIPESSGIVDRTGNNSNGSITGGTVNDGEKVAGNLQSNANVLGGGFISMGSTPDSAEIDVGDVIGASGVFTYSTSFLLISKLSVNLTLNFVEETADTSDFITMTIDDGDHMATFDYLNSWVDTTPRQDPLAGVGSHYSAAYNGTTERKIIVNGIKEFANTDASISSLGGRNFDRLRWQDDNTTFDRYVGFTYVRQEYLSNDWLKAEHDFLIDMYAALPSSLTETDIGTNVDFETGDGTGWTLDGCSVSSSWSFVTSAAFGTYFIHPGSPGAAFDPYNDIDVSAYATDIDDELCGIRIKWALGSNFTDDDTARLVVEFYDGTMTLISSINSNFYKNDTTNEWVTFIIGQTMPANTRTVRLQLEFRRNDGSNLDAAIDIDYVRIVTPA